MSGKPYTMKEMKSIVDYLTENKAYGEVKGRKMWLEFERSKLIDRTWQSLKETFLKRILPDIHNPYYQLSITQISSFRQGYDVETKLKNKLEVRAVSEESSVNAEDPENTEQPSTSNDKEVEKNSGEEKKNSRNVSHHRSSDETIVLDHCYETAEDIQRDLESPNQKDKKNEDKATHAKSLRDFITYSEPLTPMLQEVIDDFATDENGSDKESNLKISKDENNIKKSNIIAKSLETDDVRNNADYVSESRKNNENQNNDYESTNQNTEKSIHTPAQEIVDGENGTKQASKQMKSNISENSNVKSTNEDDPSKAENVEKSAFNKSSKNVTDRNKDKDGTSQRTSSQNLSNTTTDTLIPNNQEALNTMCDSINPNKVNVEPVPRDEKKNMRKRAISQEPTSLKEKSTYLNVTAKPVSVSDTDANIKRKKLITVSKSDWSAAHNPNLKETKKVSDNKNKQKIDNKKNPTEEKSDRLVHSSAEGTNNNEKSQEIQNENTGDNTINSNIKNPCLKSVSLYEEQFTSLKYSGSSDEVITSTNPNPPEEKNKKNKILEEYDLLLLSNSEPDSPSSKKRKKGAPVRTTVCKSEREKALANVFGFSSGVIAKDRKRRVSYQKRSAHRQSRRRISSGSSEWTSETDTEFVSPPRGRRNKFSRKYLKPKSARILSLEDEGGLFVMYGKKIYPVIKDGKKVKNYVTYAPERDSLEEDESYWKLKYIEEKKRTAKLTKLLRQTTEHEQQSNEADILDLTKSSPSKRTKLEKYQAEAKNEIDEIPVTLPKESSEVVKESVPQDKTLIIKITKKNEEVQLEGHWSQIHPVLNHVVKIFNKESEPKNDVGSSISSERLKSRSSRLSTPDIKMPAVQEAHEKVNKLETEIFKEIESLDKQYKRSPTPTSLSTEDSNLFINKRKRGRPKKSIQSNVSESSSPGKEKGDRAVTPQMLTIEENVEKADATQIANGTVKRQTRTPKPVQPESSEGNESKVINTRTKSLRVKQPTNKLIDNETDVLYKLPSPPSSAKKTTRKSVTNKTQNGQKSRNR